MTFAATPDFEDAKDSNTDNVYTFNVVVTDTQSGSTRRNATTSVTVTVNDVEEGRRHYGEQPEPRGGG